MSTGIEWRDATWNPVVGCTPVSPGCQNCYAATMARRLEAMGARGYTPTDGGARIAEVCGGRAVFTGSVRMVEDALWIPLRRRKPTVWFVSSMSDLYHEDVPYEYIDRVYAVMALCPDHRFVVLTKRPERMAEYYASRTYEGLPTDNIGHEMERMERIALASPRSARPDPDRCDPSHAWPMPNVALGVSVEDQNYVDRIDALRSIPAALRFLSLEPLLGSIDFRDDDDELTGLDGIHYVILGGESGAYESVRPYWVLQAQSIIDQCRAVGVPVFHKQLGSRPMLDDLGDTYGWPEDGSKVDWETARITLKDPKGSDPEEWPEHLRVRDPWPWDKTTARP